LTCAHFDPLHAGVGFSPAFVNRVISQSYRSGVGSRPLIDDSAFLCAEIANDIELNGQYGRGNGRDEQERNSNQDFIHDKPPRLIENENASADQLVPLSSRMTPR
jgi:hypothetical protein